MIVIDRLWCIDYDHTNPEYCKISNTILICFADFFVNVLVVSVMVASGLAQPRSDCPADGVVTIGHKKSCTKYYLCLGGKPMEQKCAFGLIYDHRSQKCNLEKDAKCTLDICPADKVGSVQSIPHPEDCAKYYICASGRGVQLQCGKNLLFNQITNTCDHAATVYCVRTKFWTGWVDRFDGFDDIFILYLYMLQGPPTPAPPVIITHCPPTGTKIIPYANDCKKYYLCMEGKEAVFQCTGDLVYDHKLQQCNHASLTTCL